MQFLEVVDTPVDVSTTGAVVQTVQKTVWRLWRRCCEHAASSSSSFQPDQLIDKVWKV